MKLQKSHCHGFSVIELAIILAILVFIVSISLPNLNFLNQQIVASDLEKLHMTFSYLQQLAISSNKNTILKFNKNNNTFSYDDKIEKLSKNVTFGLKEDIKISPSVESKTTDNGITFLNDQVLFYSNGKIQPGSVYLTDKTKSYNYALTVPISQVSFIRKYKYQNNKWMLI